MFPGNSAQKFGSHETDNIWDFYRLVIDSNKSLHQFNEDTRKATFNSRHTSGTNLTTVVKMHEDTKGRSKGSGEHATPNRWEQWRMGVWETLFWSFPAGLIQIKDVFSVNHRSLCHNGDLRQLGNVRGFTYQFQHIMTTQSHAHPLIRLQPFINSASTIDDLIDEFLHTDHIVDKPHHLPTTKERLIQALSSLTGTSRPLPTVQW